MPGGSLSRLALAVTTVTVIVAVIVGGILVRSPTEEAAPGGDSVAALLANLDMGLNGWDAEPDLFELFGGEPAWTLVMTVAQEIEWDETGAARTGRPGRVGTGGTGIVTGCTARARTPARSRACGGRGLNFMRCGWIPACVIGAFMLFAPQVAAQGRGPLAGLSGGDFAPLEIQRLFDAYALVQAQEMLELSDEQYGQFVRELKALQEIRRTNEQERQRFMQRLVRLSNQDPPADDAGLRDELQAFRAYEIRTAEELREAYDGVDGVLDMRQRVRFRIFEERMERRKLDLVLRASRLRPGPPQRRARPGAR